MLIDKLQSLPAQLSEQVNALWNSEYPVKLKDRFPLLLEGVDEFCHYLILTQFKLCNRNYEVGIKPQVFQQRSSKNVVPIIPSQISRSSFANRFGV